MWTRPRTGGARRAVRCGTSDGSGCSCGTIMEGGRSHPRSRSIMGRPPFLPCNTSAGSCSRRDPPRGTKTSGLDSRSSRTPARTLLPRASASPSPERPTQSLPPPDVDSHATPVAFASVAIPSVGDGSCQHPDARAPSPSRSPRCSVMRLKRRVPRDQIGWSCRRSGEP